MKLSDQTQRSVDFLMGETNRRLSELIGRPVSIMYSLRVNDISEEHIIQTVCRVCNCTWSQILDKSKEKVVVVPRQLVAWLLRKYCGVTHAKIADMMEKDRSSVIRMVEVVNDMIDSNDELYVRPLETIEMCILKLIKTNDSQGN